MEQRHLRPLQGLQGSQCRDVTATDEQLSWRQRATVGRV